MSRFYSRQNIQRFLAARRLSVAVFAFLAVVLLANLMADDSRNVADAPSSPVLRVLSAPVTFVRGVGRAVRNYFTAYSKLGRVNALEAELRQWRERAVKAESLIGGYEALLKTKPDEKARYMSARVFGDMGGTHRRHLLVKLGRQDGVRVGQAALGPNGFVGHVIAASTRTSRVMLVTDVNSHIAVLVGKSSHRAVMSGDGGGYPYLEFVQDVSELAPDMVVVTSGHDGYIPAGLPVGKLERHGSVWRVRLWETPWGLEHIRIAELPSLSSPVYQELPLQLQP